MEEIKPAQSAPTQAPMPPTPAQTLPAQSLPPLHSKNKKRPLDGNFYVQNSKMRAVLRDLRPHFLEVLKTPDFRNSKAAQEIRERIKLLLDLQKPMKATSAETVSVEKTKNAPNGQSLSADNQDHRRPQERLHDVKLADKTSVKPSESNYPSSSAHEKQKANDGQISGAYIVGGSAFGWNFITFTGNEPVYYGVTKELFREKNPIISSVAS